MLCIYKKATQGADHIPGQPPVYYNSFLQVKRIFAIRFATFS